MKHTMDLDIIMMQGRILDNMRKSNLDLTGQTIALTQGFNRALQSLGDANAKAAIKEYEDTLAKLKEMSVSEDSR